MKSKTIKSTIVVLMLLSIFTGLAAAIDDIYLEDEEDLPNDRDNVSSSISLPYGSSDIYHANINPGSDEDWCKANCNSGDHFDILIDSGAYRNYISYDSEDRRGSVVLCYGRGYTDGDGDISRPPLYIRFYNRASEPEPYADYQFFALRSEGD